MKNLWKTKNVPHKNWKTIGIKDRGLDNLTLCQMCNEQHIRYEHHMWHKNYKELTVGCVCAENMAQGYDGRSAEKLVKKESNFINKGWKESDGLMSRKYKNRDIGIFKVDNKFRFIISERGQTKHFVTNGAIGDFDEKVEAQRAVWNMFIDEKWL